MKNSKVHLLAGGVSVVMGLAVLTAPAVKARFTPASLKSKVSITVKEGVRHIVSNGVPNHAVGKFPNPNCPNEMAEQEYHFQVPVAPKESAGNRRYRGYLFGVAINGVPFDPGTGEIWNNNFEWHYEALGGYLFTHEKGLGVDKSNAHVQPTGAYHYHGLPFELLKRLDYKNKMALVGYAADGYPIYGPYAYSTANDPQSPLKEMTSGYRLKEGDRTTGPTGAYDGSFWQDYEWVKGAGDLDAFNGRFGVTPEYPRGTYYYVLTKEFPYVPRNFKGIPHESFHNMPPPGAFP